MVGCPYSQSRGSGRQRDCVQDKVQRPCRRERGQGRLGRGRRSGVETRVGAPLLGEERAEGIQVLRLQRTGPLGASSKQNGVAE